MHFYKSGQQISIYTLSYIFEIINDTFMVYNRKKHCNNTDNVEQTAVPLEKIYKTKGRKSSVRSFLKEFSTILTKIFQYLENFILF